MKVPIADLRSEIGAVKTVQSQVLLADLAAELCESAPEGVLHVKVTVTNTGAGFVVNGHIQGAVQMVCARCLEHFLCPVETDFQVLYRRQPVTDPERWAKGHEETNEQEDDVYFQGDVLDVAPAIWEHLLLALPMKPLCREDCLGLCPVCGQRCEDGDCGCDVENVDPRLAVLKDIME
ncbi:MAG TPA: DUF177 domain-containing protein [Firmicutes bacterium]|jgi:uncharacterized protein|nr:DUF177 domain-containing protein [Bacillota bacterium]